MIKDIFLSVGFGLASTLFLYFSLIGGNGGAVPGNALQTMPLMTLSIIPLFMSGLGWGIYRGTVSVAAGAAIAGILIDPLFAVTYVVTCGLPVLIIVRQALLWREEDEKIFWFPATNLMVVWSVISIALSCLAVGLLYMNDELRNELISQFDLIVPQIQEMGARFATITAEELVWFMPQFFGPFWGIIILVSGCLAQGVLVRLEKNIRPSPRFTEIQLPKWLAVVTVISVAAGMWFDGTGPIIGAVVVTLEIVFFLQGMAVIHGVSSNWNYRSLILTAVYLIMILMFWPVLVITILGLVDSWIGFRGRQNATTNQEEN